jgi:hypothetical protein
VLQGFDGRTVIDDVVDGSRHHQETVFVDNRCVEVLFEIQGRIGETEDVDSGSLESAG